MTNYDNIEFISQTITNLLLSAGIQSRVEYEDSLSRGLIFNIASPDSNLLIGSQGTSLHALEIIVHAIVAKHFSNSEQSVYFSLDVNDYKRKREWFLKQMAKDAVDKIKQTGNSVILSSMPKYERKFIHLYIQEQFPHITTESVGIDPNRKIKLSM